MSTESLKATGWTAACRTRLLRTRPSVGLRRPSSSTRSTSSRLYRRSTTTRRDLQDRGDGRPAARRQNLPCAGRASVQDRRHRGAAGRRPEPVERGRSLGAFLLRQDPRAARDPRLDWRQAMEHAAASAADGDDTHDTLDWYGFDQDGGGIHDVIGRAAIPTLSCCGRDRISSLLPFEFSAPGGATGMTMTDAERTCTMCSTSSCARASRATRTNIS